VAGLEVGATDLVRFLTNRFTDHSQHLMRAADGKWLLVGGTSGAVAAWQVSRKDSSPATLPAHDGAIVGIVADPKGRYIATAGGKELKLWMSSTWGKPARSFAAGMEMMSLAYSYGGQPVAVGCDKGMKIWDLNTGADNL
jgi:WD40 repeat protein